MKVVAAILIIFFAGERLYCTFASVRRKNTRRLWRESLFTSLMLFLYSSIVIFNTGFYFFYSPLTNSVIFFSGVLLLLIGITGRRWSIGAMGDDWSVYVAAENIGRVVTQGPFRFSRHPYYWSSILELLGISLLLQCLWGVGLTLCVYFPILIFRSYLEEKRMLDKFPVEYVLYKKTTPFFLWR